VTAKLIPNPEWNLEMGTKKTKTQKEAERK
jgi:hypothetical protein